MEWKVIKEPIAVNEVVCDSTSELPIESDMLLPDYCPDMMKILRCCATPMFTGNTAEGSSLTVEGHIHLALYYLSDTMQIRCCESKMPFSKLIDLKGTYDNPAVSVYGSVAYLNSRAVNQRRVDIRGAMNLTVKVLAQHNEEVICDARGGGMQLRRKNVASTGIAGSASRQFTVREELELGAGKPAVGTVIRKQARARVTDRKVISGKIVTKGELELELLYLSAEDEKLETMQYNLPISQIIDLAGVDESCGCDVRMEVTAADIQPKSDLDGENTLLSAEVTISALAKAFRRIEISAVSDAYSTEFEASFTEKNFTALRLAASVDSQHPFKQQMELPEEVASVLYLWCEAVHTGSKLDGNRAKMGVQMNVCMFAIDREQNPAYYEQPVELEYETDLDGACESLFSDLAASAGACDFTVTGGGVEVRCEIAVTGMLFSAVKCTALGDLSLDESRPQARDANTALTIYFAQAGENVWDIAKRYHTSVAAVMEENAMEHEKLPVRATLLIPMVV